MRPLWKQWIESGPCNASLRLKEIRDLRASKLKAIEERAKELLKDWSQGANDKEDLAEKIQGELEKAQVVMWNGLPAGSDIEKAEYVIIVEGRNDVQQLFKIGVKNTVAVNGTLYSESNYRFDSFKRMCCIC